MKLKTSRFPFILLAVITLLLAGVSCTDDEVHIPDSAFDEHIVDLQGTWKISRVLRNNQDITADLDFNKLNLTLNMDGSGPTSFDIDNAGIPFAVIKSGTWSYNDPVYPTSMRFSTGNGEQSVDFYRPPVSTGNSFSLIFSLGCSDNEYIYEFSKN